MQSVADPEQVVQFVEQMAHVDWLVAKAPAGQVEKHVDPKRRGCDEAQAVQVDGDAEHEEHGGLQGEQADADEAHVPLGQLE